MFYYSLKPILRLWLFMYAHKYKTKCFKKTNIFKTFCFH